jgi:EAL and modified HD-GYP domain-containing signal transduction protein
VLNATLLTDTQSSEFLIGLLYFIDVIVDADVQEIMNKLPLHKDMKDAIINLKYESIDFLKLCGLFKKAAQQNI